LGWVPFTLSLAPYLVPFYVIEINFRVFPEFRRASYVRRYQLLLTKLVRERLYDAACLILSDRDEGSVGGYREPDAELSFQGFVQSLVGRAMGICGAK
jgi:hypothetical protein